MSDFNIFSSDLSKFLHNPNPSNKEQNIKSKNDDNFLLFNRALWRAVILQAIIDIINESSRTESKVAKIEAKKWVFIDNEDFDNVCLMAGYKKDYIRKKIMDIMRKSIFSKKVLINTHCSSKNNNKENKFYIIVNWNLNARTYEIK
jgi:hypothetical protein